MLEEVGLNRDVLLDMILRDVQLSSSIGIHITRVNRSERAKGSDYRIVLGRTTNYYRLIALHDAL
jgi:hypothetical protein